MRSIPKHDSAFLIVVQDLLVAGFRSRHKAIVNATITTWNETFAREDALEYPAALRTVFTKLRPMVDLELPGFINDEKTEVSIASYPTVWLPLGSHAYHTIDHVFALQFR